MPKFVITAIKPGTDDSRRFLYDTDSSSLVDESGTPLVSPIEESSPPRPRVETTGKREIRRLKIQLGLSCNFSCEYCSQRFVPHSEPTHREEAESFLAGLDQWLTTAPERIEFWGGEPFVYWKTMRPLAEALRERFPESEFSVITNGSLLDEEKVDWLDRLGFSVAVSHDGPGQDVRGPDPLAEPETREAILSLYRRLAPKRRFSFNAMVNRSNQSRAAIQSYFENLVGPLRDHLVIGEGGIIDAYDEGGAAQSLTAEDAVAFRNRAFGEIRSGAAARFLSAVPERVASFVNSLRFARPIETVAQKCGMDEPENIAVDLRGNVLTCQNVSAAATSPSGVSHRIGHVSDLASVSVDTAINWRERAECPVCPMLHICKGSCLFLSGPLWDRSCDNAFSDAVPIFAAAIEFLSGYVPVRIEGPHRADRHDLWTAPVARAPRGRVIPINVARSA